MIIVAGTITLDPAKMDIAMAAAHKAAAGTRTEEGNIDYVFTVDTSQPGTVRVFEMWENQDALTAHFGLPHTQEFMGAMGDFGITGTDILKYEAGEGQPVR